MKYFTTRQEFFLCSSSIDQEEKKKLDFLLSLLDDSDVFESIKESLKKDNYQGRTRIDSHNMFATILYSFAIDGGKLRELERSCKISLDYMYLMDGVTPTHVSFANFINDIISPNIMDIFKMINIAIIKKMDLDIEDVFLDGSKFEANASKYKFVWKPTKHLENQQKKVISILSKYSIPVDLKKVNSVTVAESITKVQNYAKSNDEDLETFKVGRGHKLTQLQKDYRELQESLNKILKYEEQICICGKNRNSYYKTDHDATAMCLKEDYYSGLGSNMHAAYNAQLIVSKGLILGVNVNQNRNDYQSLIPCLDQYKEFYGHYPKNVCADAGYGSHSNYKFLEQNKIGNYVKYPSWEGERKGTNPQLFNIVDGNVVCLNNKIGEIVSIPGRHPKNESAHFYKFTGCRRCEYKVLCKARCKVKTESFRIAEICPEYIEQINCARKNLLSSKGIEMRVNRSIQVEGDFGNLKQNLSYDRFRRRGLAKVTTEMILMAIGVNIRKYLRFALSSYVPSFWVAPENLQPESMPKIKIRKRVPKKKSANQRTKASYKYKKKAVKP